MVDNERYGFFDKVFLRAPLYSFADFGPWKLQALLGDDFFRQAIWLASSEFYQELEKKRFVYGEMDDRTRFTLFKYYNRMSFRATPFGAFASYSLAEWTAGHQARLVKEHDISLRQLPSLKHIGGFLDADKPHGPEVKLSANPTLYRVGASWRFTRSVSDASGKLSFFIHGLRAAATNNFLIRIAGKQAYTKSSLIAVLCKRTGAIPAEAEDYIDFLIREQVLFTSKRAALIEKEPAADWPITRKPDNADKSAEYPPFRPPATSKLDPSTQPYYAALERPLQQGGISSTYQEKISGVIAVLARITPDLSLSTAFDEFKTAFRARYDARKVPLLTVMDPDTGIGYAGLHRPVADAGLLDHVRFPVDGKGRNYVEWTPAHRMLLRVWVQNTNRGAQDPVSITDSDLEALPFLSSARLPNTICVLFRLVAGKLLIENAGGASATSLPGRFSAFSTAVYKYCKDIAAYETAANPDVVFAEPEQLSHDHVDNINRRCQIFDYLIPVNTYAQAGTKGLIMPGDLWLSLAGNELILESASLGKRVIPRLPTAYNYYHNNLPLFRLLCDLQYQGLHANLNFDPEKLFPGMPYYPRITYGDTILSLARWNLRKEEVSLLTAEPPSLGRLHLFREQHGIPRHVLVGRGDQQLVFDLGNDDESGFFLKTLKEANTEVIREYLVADNTVTDGGKPFAAQMIACLKNPKAIYNGQTPVLLSAGDSITRDFPPGSEWLYIQVFCNQRSADRLLLEEVIPLISRNKRLIKEWFFIRYQDPEPHLRLRIHLKEPDAAPILVAFKQILCSGRYKELISRYVPATYERELERYTPALIGLVEKWFCAGSLWAVAYLRFKNNSPVMEKIQVEPLALIDRICRIFLRDTACRTAFYIEMSGHFFTEFKADKKLRLDFDRKYRDLAKPLEISLENVFCPALRRTTKGLLENTLTIADKSRERKEVDRMKLLGDLVHMQVNRLYSDNQRRYEGLIYHCLSKYTKSLLARSGLPGKL